MFRKLFALRVTRTRFYISGHGARKYFGGPNFFENEYLSKFFVTKVKKTLVIMMLVIKHHYTNYAFVNSKIKSLGLIFCYYCIRRFQKSMPPKNLWVQY